MNSIEKILKKFNIYTLKEASVILGIKEDTLLKQILRGKYEAYRLGSGNRTFWLVQLEK